MILCGPIEFRIKLSGCKKVSVTTGLPHKMSLKGLGAFVNVLLKNILKSSHVQHIERVVG